MIFEGSIEIDFEKLGGLAPVVLQDAGSNDVLMVGFVNKEAWKKTLETGVVTLFRRTLGRVQVKGEDEGQPPLVIDSVVVDCDFDTILLKVNPNVPVCHFGDHTCFTKPIDRRR